ncbi:hypothetical protein L9F63_013712 [Diploptera punctata]|uniref:Exonuclease domain-containing protein n=1 Tax=Diploptera punctata TaxID=6984 RepID=A0AAD8AAD9_DIPPU|nr:hypothetical protein L9F63_013712 [Diploptera punctata]
MKPLTTKQLQRMEKKKKKLAAFLEIAKLNDKDREARALMLCTKEDGEILDISGNSTDIPVSREEPKRKRQKKNDEIPLQETKKNIVSIDSQIVCKSPVKCEELNHEIKPESHGASNLFSDLSENRTKQDLTSEQYAELKRALREKKSHLSYIPRFHLKDMGFNACIKEEEDDRTPLFISDIQHLLMYALMGFHSPYVPSRWCHIEKNSRISHTVVFVIEGISLYDYQSHESLCTNMKEVFTNKLEVITSVSYNNSLIQELAAVPLTITQKNRILKEYGSLEVALKHREDLFKVFRAVFPVIDSSLIPDKTPRPATDQFPRTMLLLSAAQLIEENYPLPLKGKHRSRYQDFVFTKDVYQEVTPSSPMFGLDCEMCRTTTRDLELTRISIVNEKLEVVYETLVKPYNSITDYLTRFSGITKSILKNVTMRLEDVQRDIRALLPPDAILVGQSLNFDLLALKMMHPYIIDTSVIYNITGDRLRKTKLSFLAQKFLGEEIQQSVHGHCSVEDSTTSMKLTQLKLANDRSFGAISPSSQKDKHCRIHRIKKISTSLFSHVSKMEKTVSVIGSEEVIDEYSRYLSEAVYCGNRNIEENNKGVKCVVTSNESVVVETCNVAREHTFTISHLKLDRAKYCDDSDLMKEVNQWCCTIWENMAYNGLCVVLFSGVKGGANGAAFIEIKRPPTILRRT